MKNILKGLFFMSMAAVLFSGCQKDGDMMSFGATADRFSSDDKAYMDGNYMQWNASDRVMINGTGYDLTYADGTATITGVTKASNDIYAAQYPEAMNGVFNSFTTTFTTISISDTRAYKVSGGNQVVDAPMVAYVDASNNNQNNEVLRFKNVSALYKIDLTNGFNSTFKVSKISVATNSNACPLTGNGFSIINVSGSNPTLSKDARIVDADSMATMTFTDGQVKVEAHNNTPVTIYFPLPPTNSSAKFTFRVYGTMGGAECVFTRSVTLASTQASKLYTVPISLTNDNYTTVKGAAFSGQGTSENPYKIATADDFSKLALCVNNDSSVATGFTAYKNAYYEVTATGSISLSGFTPIGTSSKPFQGHFNGNGVAITSLSISGSYAYAGLFGYCSGATIENLTIGGATITASSATAAGAICGYANNTTINQCRISGLVTFSSMGSSSAMGNIVGQISGGEVKNCKNAGAIYATYSSSGSGSSSLAGICGYNGGTISNSYNLGMFQTNQDWEQTSTQPYAGGIVGVNNGTVQNCYSDNIPESGSFSEEKAGIVIGNNNGNVNNCYACYETDPDVEWRTVAVGADDAVTIYPSTYKIGRNSLGKTLNAWGSISSYIKWSELANVAPDLTCFSGSKSAKGTKSKGAKGPQMAPAYAGFYQGR